MQTPLLVKNLTVGAIGFTVAAMIAVWNLWVRDGGLNGLVVRMAGGDPSGDVYPAVPWLIPAVVIAVAVIIMLGLQVDQKWRRVRAQRRGGDR